MESRQTEAQKVKGGSNGMNKPYYEIDSLTTGRILGLISKCEELNLGNVKFEYMGLRSDIIFSMDHMKEGWALAVIMNQRH